MMRKMKNWTTKNGVEVIQVSGGRCNAFLVRQAGHALLIDTGRKHTRKELSENLDQLGLGENGISALILTHTHFDHAENAASIKEKYNTRIFVHQSEAEFLRMGDSPLPRGSILPTWIMMKMAALWVQPFFRYQPVDSDIMIEDGYDMNPWGLNARVLHTPGHTAGSISLIVDDEIAIVGDILVGMFKRSVFSPFTDDARLMVESWKKLLDTGCSVFLPAHGSSISRELLQSQYEKYSWR